MDKNLLSQLRDIDGLDAVSWWPLAPGWWFLLLAAVAIALLIGWLGRREAKPPGWKVQLSAALKELRAETDGKKKAAAISALLRQLAMERYGRAACAGLEGTAWLDWLAQHDPAQFDWRGHGKLLIEAPYAPVAPAPQEMDPLIAAAEKWM